MWHDSLILDTTYTHTRDMTHPESNGNDTYYFVTLLVALGVSYLCDVTHSLCDVTHSCDTRFCSRRVICAWHDSLVLDITDSNVRDMTYPESNGKDTLSFALSGSYVCDVTHSHVWRDSFICVILGFILGLSNAWHDHRFPRLYSRHVIYMWHDSLIHIFVTCLLHMRVTWLI